MEKKFYNVVANEQMVKDFLKDIGVENLTSVQSYLVQTAFRTKMLNDKERELLGNRHKDSFMIKTLKTNKKTHQFEYEEAINRLYELEIPVRACTYNIGTEQEVSFPQSAFVTYIMPNPTNEISVAAEHAKKVTDAFADALKSSENGQVGFKEQIAHSNNDFRSERATFIESNCNTSFVNFDIDFQITTGYEAWEGWENQFRKIFEETFSSSKDIIFNPSILVVVCNGGFHVLVPKGRLFEDPNKSIEKMRGAIPIAIEGIEYKGAKSYTPLPGTYQYGDDENHIVRYAKI